MARYLLPATVAILALTLLAPDSAAQVFSRTLGDTGTDRAAAGVTGEQGTTWVAGRTDSYGSGSADGWLVEFDLCGSVIREWAVGTAAAELFRGLALLEDGGLLAVGDRRSAAGDLDFWIVRTDAEGALTWSITIGGSGDESASSVVPLADGSFVVAGDRFQTGSSLPDAWLVRLDSSGSPLWQRSYGGLGGESVRGMLATAEGDLFGVGSIHDVGEDLDLWLFRIGDDGLPQWQRSLGGSEADGGAALLDGGDGSLGICGFTDSFGSGLHDMWALRTDGSGSPLWQQAYGGIDDDECSALTRTGSERWLLAGYSFSFGAGDLDGWALELDSTTGGLLRQQRHGDAGDEIFVAAASSGPDAARLIGSRVALAANDADVTIAGWDAETGLIGGEAAQTCALSTGTAAGTATTTATGPPLPLISNATDEIVAYPPTSMVTGTSILTTRCAAIPAEVGGLAWTNSTELRWDEAAMNCADSFEVYAGGLTALMPGSGGTCLQDGLALSVWSDGSAPPLAGEGRFYLVRALGSGGAGSLGRSSDGNVRVGDACP